MGLTDIRVAVVGGHASGKSTVINAILGGNYTEMLGDKTSILATQREDAELMTCGTTKGVFCFRLAGTQSAACDDALRDSIRLAVEKANALDREKDLFEKVFDLPSVDQSLCEMWEKAALVLIDVPCVREQRDCPGRMYVEDNWHMFDCVVAVIDSSTPDHQQSDTLNLLRFLKKNNEERRTIPLIVLCNKVDDSRISSVREKVETLQVAIEGEFGVSNRQEALAAVMGSSQSKDDPFPVFVPISARRAFLYRYAATFGYVDFERQLGKEFYEQLGRDVFGMYWEEMTSQERHDKLYERTHDTIKRHSAIESSNFDAVLKAVSFCIGGEAKQRRAVQHQLAVIQSKLLTTSHTQENIAASLKAIRDRCLVLGVSSRTIADTFWNLYERQVGDVFASFVGPHAVAHVARPMEQLCAFIDFAKDAGFLAYQRHRIVKEAEELVARQIAMVLDRSQWSDLSAFDWALVYGSMLMASSNNPHFCEKFGLEMILLDFSLRDMNATHNQGICPACHGPLVIQHHRLFMTGHAWNKACATPGVVITDMPADTCKSDSLVQVHGLLDPANVIFFLLATLAVGSTSVQFLSIMIGLTTKCCFLLLMFILADGTLRPKASGYLSWFFTFLRQSKSISLKCQNCNALFVDTLPKSPEAAGRSFDSLKPMLYRFCGHQENSGQQYLEPVNPELFKKYVHVHIPRSLSDVNHMGHLIWRFGSLVEALENKETS